MKWWTTKRPSAGACTRYMRPTIASTITIYWITWTGIILTQKKKKLKWKRKPNVILQSNFNTTPTTTATTAFSGYGNGRHTKVTALHKSNERRRRRKISSADQDQAAPITAIIHIYGLLMYVRKQWSAQYGFDQRWISAVDDSGGSICVRLPQPHRSTI